MQIMVYMEILQIPTMLFYIGGEKIIANAINQKDNTLFLGNLKIERLKLEDSIKTAFKK